MNVEELRRLLLGRLASWIFCSLPLSTLIGSGNCDGPVFSVEPGTIPTVLSFAPSRPVRSWYSRGTWILSLARRSCPSSLTLFVFDSYAMQARGTQSVRLYARYFPRGHLGERPCHTNPGQASGSTQLAYADQGSDPRAGHSWNIYLFFPAFIAVLFTFWRCDPLDFYCLRVTSHFLDF